MSFNKRQPEPVIHRRPSVERICVADERTPTPSVLGGTVDPESFQEGTTLGRSPDNLEAICSMRGNPAAMRSPGMSPLGQRGGRADPEGKDGALSDRPAVVNMQGSPAPQRPVRSPSRSPAGRRSTHFNPASMYRMRSTRQLSGTWSNSHSFTGTDSTIGKVWLFLILYGVATFVLQTDMMLPWGAGFSIVLVWVASTLGGEALRRMKMPPLLGNLIAGMLLKNLLPDGGDGKSVRGLPDGWASDIITFGLTIIFLRGGLEIDLNMVRQAGLVATRLTVMPGVSEAIVVAAFSTIIFDMNLTLGLSLGFILAAVSPAVVVGAMFELKKHGYGVAKNIPVLIVAAASFDDVVAISGFTVFISFAISSGPPDCSGANSTLVLDADIHRRALASASNCSSDNHHSDVKTFLDAFHGPITVVLGLSLGVLAGRIAAMTELWDLPWKRTAIVAGQGLFLSFGAKMLESRWTIEHAHPIGANTGILASLTMAGVAAFRWERGLGLHGNFLAYGGSKEFQQVTEGHLAELWNRISQPLLFGVVGSYLDFRSMPGETVVKAVLIILCGLTARTCAAFFATAQTNLNVKERLFVAFAWMPKATVQAAFCGYPLTVIDRITESGGWVDEETRLQHEKWGQDILTTGVLAILLTAPAGLIFIQRLGPKWLDRGSKSSDTADLENGSKMYELHEFHDVAFLEEVPLVKRLLEVQVPYLVEQEEEEEESPDVSVKRTHSLEKIASFLMERTFKAGEIIIKEGEDPDEDGSFYIIRSGQVKCTKGGVEVCPHLGRGEFFGELALMSNEKRAATVTAMDETTVLILGRSNFKRLLEPLSEYMIESHSMLYGQGASEI